MKRDRHPGAEVSLAVGALRPYELFGRQFDELVVVELFGRIGPPSPIVIA